MKIRKEEIKTWGALPHAASQTHKKSSTVLCHYLHEVLEESDVSSKRDVPPDQLSLSVAWQDISHQLTYVQLTLSHTVLLCLHLPVCINHTIINLLCWREGLMKTGFSSSFLCYDMLLLGVEGLCGEHNVWWELFLFLYTYWADQMLWRRVPAWLFCEIETENDGKFEIWCLSH